MTLRVVDPEEASAIVKAATAPTRLQQAENMLRVWLRAKDGLVYADTDAEHEAAWLIVRGAAEATRKLLGDDETTPGAAA